MRQGGGRGVVQHFQPGHITRPRHFPPHQAPHFPPPPWAVAGRYLALPFCHRGRSRVTRTLRERHLYPPTPRPSSSTPMPAQLLSRLSEACRAAQKARFETNTFAYAGVRVTRGEVVGLALRLPGPLQPPWLSAHRAWLCCPGLLPSPISIRPYRA